MIGAPLTPEPAADKGFSIQRYYYTLDGEPADISKVKQNERFAVVLKITEGSRPSAASSSRIICRPGFEIDNPRLVSSGDTGTLSWIEDAKEPAHSEFRDDRFTAAFDRASSDKAVFTVAYVVRAVSPGKYVLPQAYVEDMYRPDRFGRTGVGSVEIEAREVSGRVHQGGGGALRAAAVALATGDRSWRGAFCGLGLFARPRAARRGHRVLDRRGRPQRAAAAALRDAGRPLAAAGDRRRMSIRAISTC